MNERDEAALAALYDEYGERLYDYAMSMSGDGKVAADIVHDTFIDACRRAPRMRDHLHLSSWLYGAARRRCIRRGRAKVLFWDRDGEFTDIPFLDRAEPDDPVPDWPPADELHDLLRASLVRLEPVDQEVVLLAFRHGLRPARLGATLGLTARRAAMRVRKARAALEAALRKEAGRLGRDCAATEPPAEEPKSTAVAVLAARAPVREKREEEAPPPAEPDGKGRWQILHRRGDDSPADPSAELHAAECPDCRRRGRVTAAALLRRAPAPVLPAALRHRVMHTATDPELAGYRADIAARGGALTPSGLPSQPDVPSPFTRRWLFTGGGMAGALAAALVAVFVMGPGIGANTLSWPPFRTHPQPSITHEKPESQGHGKKGQEGPGGVAQGRPGQAPPNPQTGDGDPKPRVPSRPPPSSNRPAKPGVLVVNPAKVEMYGTKTASVSLAAKSGPVTWTAMTSSSQLILSEMQGGMPADGTTRLTLTLRTALIGLPGQGTLTFTDSEGAPHEVTVVWGATIL
ncbi:RNA polymerase sigma factor [Actinomadura darangshiensis]|uniref:RNA polymerase sigma factor n=1 Tax=Actinomadura darangshiensis TaxID=705336 RepID=UPI00140944C9|nr:sigma-70 family RNA polymerase sigma factor [Actinomadura darangshiensis]